MIRPVPLHLLRLAGTLASGWLAAGCSCHQDYTFPQADAPFESADPGDVGSWLSFDTDPSGSKLTMAYYDRVAGGLMYAIGTPDGASTTGGGFTWTYEKVDGWPASNGLDSGDRGKYASQATAPDGTVWIAYQDVALHKLMFAHRTGGPVWETGVADEVGGEWASLALDAGGNPVIAHQDPTTGALRVTRRSGDAWTTEEALVGQPWAGTDADGNPVARPAGAGRFARIETACGAPSGSADAPDPCTYYLASYDAAWQQLVLLEGHPGAWTKTIVDGAGAPTPGAVPDAGAWPSIRVEDDRLQIAYQDLGAQTLRLATRSAGSWTLETVDPTAWRGSDTEIFALDDQTAIVYFDGYENNQILAVRQANGSWKIAKAAGDDGAVGYHNEVAVVAGEAWLGSYDFTHHTLSLHPAE